ncbi:CapA family protein [Wenzhouxiangella sp. EGI_FJ10305]|uniref:CapA family protein n=1 Tax=Wenzhouxiangella sp. EGI_FJ10305 TaxID=3243768 RepID=UPI0035DAC2A1
MSTRIAFTGDFCPIGRLDPLVQKGRGLELFPGIQEFFRTCDLVVMDLECPLTDAGEPITKTGPHLRGSPRAARVMKELGCNLAATANNHFMDFGWQGAQDTFKALEQDGMGWLGSGRSMTDASRHHVIERNGLKFAFINMTETEWSTTQGEEPGCCPIDYPTALREIAGAREAADFVFVILHGGHEHYELPSPRMQRQFRFMIDAGADSVIGHHTHVISGHEWYRGKPIFYSLGNFCIDDGVRSNSPWNRGLILVLEVDDSRQLDFTLHPVVQNDKTPGTRLMSEAEAEQAISQVECLSSIIANEDALASAFDDFCRVKMSIVRSQIQPYRNPLLVALHRRGLLPSLIGRRKRRLLAALCQCESHREVLLYALRDGQESQ